MHGMSPQLRHHMSDPMHGLSPVSSPMHPMMMPVASPPMVMAPGSMAKPTLVQPVLPQSLERYTGELKFFNEANEYGFIISEADGQDVFFHYDDVRKEHCLKKNFLRYAKESYIVRFSFNILAYFGHKGLSKKAVDIELIELTPLVKTAE